MYVLAQLVGINVAQLFSKDAKVPKLEEIFPHLFNSQQEEELMQNSPKLSKTQASFLAGLLNKKGVNVIDNKDKDM